MVLCFTILILMGLIFLNIKLHFVIFLPLNPLQSALLFFGLLLFLIGCVTTQPEPEPEELTIEYLITLSDQELMERDSDGDGLSDYDEIYVYGTDPLNPDTDGDGLSDYDEIFVYGTDPLNKDTSGNGFTDGQEVEMGTNPIDPNDPPFIRSYELQPVPFPFGIAEPDDSALEILDQNRQKLLYAEEFRVELIILSNDAELTEGDHSLFNERAGTVIGFMVDGGVSENRIDITFRSVAISDCPEGTIDEHGSCPEIQQVKFIPINPYPFYPEY